MSNCYIYEALRSPRGKGKEAGKLQEVKPIHLLMTVLEALRSRLGFASTDIDDLLIGCATPVGEQGGNIARGSVLYARWAEQLGGAQINRFCASGLEALSMAAAQIHTGWADAILAGGLESMSRIPLGSDGSPLFYDPAVSSRANYLPQGVCADLLASLEGYSRQELDAYALRSHERAAAAEAQGFFDRARVSISDLNGICILDRDEHIRSSCSIEKLAALSPAFAQDGALGFDARALRRYPQIEQIQHLHTAGNSCGMVDGAAAALLGSLAWGEKQGLRPRARIVAAATIGSEPTLMLTGACPATKKALQKAKLQASDIDLWEVNEAFAASALHFQRNWDIPDEQYNVLGGAIAMGHPLGATGPILLSTLLDELERQDKERGLIAMPTIGAMGSALIIERV